MGNYIYLEVPPGLEPWEMATLIAAAWGAALDLREPQSPWTWCPALGWAKGPREGLWAELQDKQSIIMPWAKLWVYHINERGEPTMTASRKVWDGNEQDEATRRLTAIARQTGGEVRFESQEPIFRCEGDVTTLRTWSGDDLRFERKPYERWNERLMAAVKAIQAEVA